MESDESTSKIVEYPRPKREEKKPQEINMREVLLVLGVIAIILILIAPSYVSSGGGRSKVAKVQADLATLRGSIDQFNLDCGRYPTSLEGFEALRFPPKGLKNWNGPYMQKEIPPDTWGRPYVYRRTWAKGKAGYIVESYGADGKPGGTGADADITDGSDWGTQ